jgi:hypothetical protein
VTFWQSSAWLEYEQHYRPAVPRAQELVDATWQTRVIDLTQDDAKLWMDLRKSYKALIHNADRDYHYTPSLLADGPLVIAVCQALHAEAAGRVTRPQATWDLMGRWIDQRHAFAFLAYRQDRARAFAYFLRDGTWAYYASAAALEPNVNHALIWQGMKAAKQQGVTQFEIGWQGHAADEKGKQIEFFKRGFGGRDVPANFLAHSTVSLASATHTGAHA